MQSDYVNKKLQESIDRIENNDRTLGLSNLVHNPEAEKLLALSQNELDKMTAEECACAKYILSQHALVIQKTINRATSLKNWCERSIRTIIAKEYATYDSFMKYEVRRQFVVNGNEYGKQLDDIALEQELKIDNLNYIAQAINNMATSFQLLYNSKKRVEFEASY